MAASSKGCIRRLHRELAQLKAHGISPTVYIVPQSGDITILDALIIGPPDTPYDGAMFHFRINVPPEYPLKPPHMRFMMTDGGSLRIHPQLYADGKVCLSILGTWHGPRWTASQSLSTLLLSVQSLLNEEPLRCEPGLEDSSQDAVDRANVFVVHEATRVLIVGALSGTPSWGQGEDVAPLTAAMHSHLRGRRSAILKRLGAMSAKHDNQVLREPFAFSAPVASRRYNFAALMQRLSDLLPEGEDPPTMPGPSFTSCSRTTVPSAPQGSSSEPSGQQEQPEHPASDDEDIKAYCRICHQTAEESSMPLITPCRCAGSMRYAHAKCILKWLEYSGQGASSSEFRCDICRTKLRVTFGGGKPPGLAYFRRDMDVCDDPGFDAPGLVSLLLIGFAQIMTTSLGRVTSQSIHGSVFIVCRPLPEWLGGPLSVVLVVPVILVEVLTYCFYLVMLCVKLAVAFCGPRWRPVDWGNYCEERIGLILGLVADNFFALGLRLDSILCFGLYFSVAQGCGILGNTSIMGLIMVCMLGSKKGGHLLWAIDLGLMEQFPGLRSLLPGTASAVLQYVHLPASALSLCLNMFAIAGLLRRAFFERHPVPSDVLPASPSILARGVKRPAPVQRKLARTV